MGRHEGVDNHFSAAVPGADGRITGDRFLINPFGWHWSEITASSLVLCDADGTVLEGEETVEATAFCIHSRIHVNNPEAGSEERRVGKEGVSTCRSWWSPNQ